MWQTKYIYWQFLRIWDWDWIFGRAVKEIFLSVVCSLSTLNQNSLIYEAKIIIIFGQNSLKLDILRLLLMFILFLAARARAFLALLLCFLSALLYFSAFYQYNGRLTAWRAAASIGASHIAANPRAGHAAPPPPAPPKPW